MAESTSHSMKAENQNILYQLKQLQLKFNALDHEKSKSAEFKNLFLLIEEVDKKYCKEFQNEKCSLQQQITKIRTKVIDFKGTLREVQIEPPSVEKIKGTLEDIEKSIVSFKEKQKQVYDQLLKDEVIVWQELTAYKRQIDSWTSVESDSLAIKVAQNSTTNKPAVNALQEFLYKTGGRSGGWEAIDHQMFVKLWTKYKGTRNMLVEAVRELPSHTSEDIERHFKWYAEYISLQEQNRKVINDWKKLKEDEKKQAMKNASTGDSQQLKKSRDREKEDKEKKLKIQQWKEEQEKKKVAETEQEQIRKNIIEQMKEKRKQERQEIVKRKLEEYSKRKEDEKKRKVEQENIETLHKKQMTRLANTQIHLYQSRDSEKLKEKQSLLAARNHEEELKKARIEKIKESITVERDPSRLLKPTLVWEERQKVKNDETKTHSVISIPKRGIPSWRQGLY